MSKWISVKERMPPDGEIVYVKDVNGRKAWCAWGVDHTWLETTCCTGCDIDKITHWSFEGDGEELPDIDD